METPLDSDPPGLIVKTLTEAGWSWFFSLQPAIASWMKKETGGGSMMSVKGGQFPQDFPSYTGHEDYDTMKPYIALTDKTRKKMMETNF